MPLIISYNNQSNSDGYYTDYIGFQGRMYQKFLDYYQPTTLPDLEIERGFTRLLFNPYNPATAIVTDFLDYWEIDLNGGNDSWAWLTMWFWLDPGYYFFNPRFVLNGGAGNDTIGGGCSDDTLSGGTGDDLYLESWGNDLYIISDSGDSIVVSDTTNNDWYGGAVAGGNDTVESSVNFVLPVASRVIAR